jgi:Leucine-rich repeat (LRR) protein
MMSDQNAGNGNGIPNQPSEMRLEINDESNNNQQENYALVQYDLSSRRLPDTELIQDEYLNENSYNLEKLILTDNLIKEITPLFLKFYNLMFLDLSKNNISKVENIHTLLNLEIFILSQNNIKMIGTSFAHLKKLKLLDLSFNQIYINEGSIKVFKYNPHLVSLSLEGNLNYNFETIKYKCLETLDSLEILDGVKIFKKRRQGKSSSISGQPGPTVKFLTKRGEGKDLKRLKEYIKHKKNDILENQDVYTKEQERAKEISTRITSTRKSMDNLFSSYYYNNKF